MKKQETQPYFSGLPSPAAAIAAMGIMMVYPEPAILVISIGIPVVAKNIPYIRQFSRPINAQLFGKNKTLR